MVLGEWGSYRLEIQRVTIMDSRETYASQLPARRLTLMAPLFYSRLREKHAHVCCISIPLFVQFIDLVN